MQDTRFEAMILNIAVYGMWRHVSGRSLLTFLGNVLPAPSHSCETLAMICLTARLLLTFMAAILYVSLNYHPWDQTALHHVSWLTVVRPVPIGMRTLGPWAPTFRGDISRTIYFRLVLALSIDRRSLLCPAAAGNSDLELLYSSQVPKLLCEWATEQGQCGRWSRVGMMWLIRTSVGALISNCTLA
jgi:hypothetical protein